MKYEYQVRTNAQHAPITGCSGGARQTSPSLPDHTASMRKNRSSGGTTQAMHRMQTSVSAILPGDENRFARIQPTAPARLCGGGKRSAGVVRRKLRGVSEIAAIAVSAPPLRFVARRDS